jgi:hypothetical protein
LVFCLFVCLFACLLLLFRLVSNLLSRYSQRSLHRRPYSATREAAGERYFQRQQRRRMLLFRQCVAAQTAQPMEPVWKPKPSSKLSPTFFTCVGRIGCVNNYFIRAFLSSPFVLCFAFISPNSFALFVSLCLTFLFLTPSIESANRWLMTNVQYDVFRPDPSSSSIYFDNYSLNGYMECPYCDDMLPLDEANEHIAGCVVLYEEELQRM